MHDLVVRDGLCFIKGNFVECSIGIDGNVITEVSKNVGRGKIEIDARGKLVLPGIFNAHTHSAMTLLRGYAESLPLKEWLEKIWEAEKKLKEEDVYWGAMLACVEMLKSGVTAFADMYFHMDGVARAVGETGMRAVIGYGMIDRNDVEIAEKELRIAKKVILDWDGAFDGRITTMLTPHAPYTCSKDFLERINDFAREKGLVKHIHLAETLWEVREIRKRYGKRPAEFLESIGFLDSKTVLAHAVWLSESEIEILSKRKVSVAHCPASNLKLSSGIAKIAEMANAGINVAIGTDGAASNNMLNVLSDARIGALLQNLRGKSLKPEEWLKMSTENGYRAYGLKGGKIEEGLLADIVIFEKTFRNAPLHNCAAMLFVDNSASHVIVDGKIVLEEGLLVNVDEAKVVEKAERVAKKLGCNF